MENGTNTGKFSNCISCILRSGNTEINFALLFWSIDLISMKPFWYIFFFCSKIHMYRNGFIEIKTNNVFKLNQEIFSIELFIIIIVVIFEK